MKVDKSKWQKSTLREIGTIFSGATPRTDTPSNWEGGTLNWVTPAELKGDKFYGKTNKRITHSALATTKLTLMPPGTVLLSSRAPIGKVAITKEPMYCNQGFKNILCGDSVYNEFLYYYLLFNNDELNRRGNGVTFKEISKKIVEAFPMVVPPMMEQRGIAAELDTIQAMIDGYREQIADLDKLAQSIFLESFGDPISNPKGWETTKMDAICTKITDGTHLSPKWTDNGIPFIFVSNVKGYEISFNVQKYISEQTYNELWKSTPIEIGDIIYTSVGSYGNPAIVKTDKKFMFQRHIALIKPVHEVVNNVYLTYFLTSPSGKKQADDKAIGAAQKTLNLKAIKKFDVLLPPLELQKQFAAQVKAIERQKELLRQQLADAETLMAERMQYYFS